MDKQRIHSTKTVLSMKLSEAVNILYADIIEKKALDLLNYPNAITFPAGNYMFKVNNRNTRTRCEICSKLTIKTPERR